MTTAVLYPDDGTAVRCDCGHREKLMEIHPGQDIEVVDGRHGLRHQVSLAPRVVLERLSGTTGPEAVLAWVRRVLT